MQETLAQKIEFFSSLIQCSTNLSYWELDPELNLIKCNSPDDEILYNIFSTGTCFTYLKEFSDATDSKRNKNVNLKVFLLLEGMI